MNDELVVSLAARLEALNVIARYAHCYDESDWRGLSDLFHEHADFTVGGGAIVGIAPVLRGRPEIVQAMRGRRERTSSSIRRHAVSTIDVMAQDAAAIHARSYLLTTSVDRGQLRVYVSGRYSDVLTPGSDGRWRFRSRCVTVDAAPTGDAPTA